MSNFVETPNQSKEQKSYRAEVIAKYKDEDNFIPVEDKIFKNTSGGENRCRIIFFSSSENYIKRVGMMIMSSHKFYFHDLIDTGVGKYMLSYFEE